MLAPSQCWKRRCIHFTGISDAPEAEQVNCCEAFPQGIPSVIAYGPVLHIDAFPGDHGVTYQRDPDAKDDE